MNEELLKATDLLGLQTDYKDTTVLQTYKNIFEETNRKIQKKKLTEAKNLIIRDIIEKQLTEQNFFSIEVPPDFNPCESCRGTGEIYRLEIIKIVDKCSYCKGSGTYTEPCKRCNGTGLIDNKKCPTCKGTKIYVHKKMFPKRPEDKRCSHCNGSGDAIKIIKTGKIDIHTTCITCRGSGMKKVKYKRSLPHPVITKDIGKVIKEQLP